MKFKSLVNRVIATALIVSLFSGFSSMAATDNRHYNTVDEAMSDIRKYVGVWNHDNTGWYFRVDGSPEEYKKGIYLGFNTDSYGWFWVADEVADVNGFGYTYHLCLFNEEGYLNISTDAKVSREGYYMVNGSVITKVE